MKISALLAAALLSLAAAVPAAADDGQVAPPADPPGATSPEPGAVTLTWPEDNHVNLDTESYRVVVEDPAGGGVLVADWNGTRTLLPRSGSAVVDLGAGGEGVVRVLRCSSAEPGAECAAVGESPVLAARSGLAVRVKGTQLVGPYRSSIDVRVDEPATASVDVHWELRGVGDEVLGSGTSTSAPVVGTAHEVPLDLPAGLVDGAYRLLLTTAATVEPWGRLHDEHDVALTWDATAPGARIHVSDATINPRPDDFRDTVFIYGGSAGTRDPILSKPRMQLLSPDGVVLREQRHTLRWAGRDDSGAILPEGTYGLRFSAQDRAGNPVVVTRTLRLSHKALRYERWTRTLTAERLVVQSWVGRCSTLSRPAVGGPRGSLGLYSQTRCARPAQSHVVVEQGVHVPPSFTGRYRSFRVSVTGGAARGERDAYLVLWYVDREGELVLRRQVDGRRATYAGHTTKNAARLIHDDRSGRPAIWWRLALSEGSRYDVDEVTVTMEREVLR